MAWTSDCYIPPIGPHFELKHLQQFSFCVFNGVFTYVYKNLSSCCVAIVHFFHNWRKIHGVNLPQFMYPFCCWWTFGLFSYCWLMCIKVPTHSCPSLGGYKHLCLFDTYPRVAGGPWLRIIQLTIFDITVVWTRYERSRNDSSDSEFWSFPGLASNMQYEILLWHWGAAARWFCPTVG